MLVNVPKLGKPNLYGYQYDQLNRIVRMDAFTELNAETNAFTTAPLKIKDYHEEISYDPNGNIKTYLRNGDSRSLAMDKLDYKYIPNTNKLNHVTDFVTTATPSDYRDIKSQSPDNYEYDSIGNLTRDNQEGISRIDWTVYGKIKQITKTSGSSIRYGYDAGGNRISKIAGGDSTYYVRDASGNVMSVYNKKNAFNLVQAELPVYGSSRLGVYNVAVDMQDCPPAVPAAMTIFTRGSKFFELSNHLGNVLATITDKNVQHSTDGTTIDYYTAEVNSASDYYPFGMQMPGRKGGVTGSGSYTPTTTTAPPPPTTAVADLVVYSRPTNSPAVYEATNSITFEVNFASTTGDIFEARILEQPATSPGGNTFGGGTWSDGEGGVYRYGFNGKENDNDVKGEGNQQDYGFRIHDPRLGRFLSVDPLTKKYPMLTPYQFAGNMPIKFIDLDGAEPAENPTSPGPKEKVAMATVETIFYKVAEHSFKKNFVSSGFWHAAGIEGAYSCSPNILKGAQSTEKGEYVTDNTDIGPAKKLNLFVSSASIFNVDESKAKKFDNYEALVVSELMTNFVSGHGPENYNFPTNGIISSKFFQSDIFTKALDEYNGGILKPNETKQYGFGIVDLFKDAVRNWTPFNITGMTGSGTITFTKTADGVLVKIFNITSLSSGALIKNPSDVSTYPNSYVRDPATTTKYGNISQTFNLFIPKESSLLKK